MCFRLLQLGLLDSTIELKQQVAFLDLGAFLEQHFFEQTRDLGANLNGCTRFGAADEVRGVGDLALNGMNDNDFGGLRRRRDRAGTERGNDET